MTARFAPGAKRVGSGALVRGASKKEKARAATPVEPKPIAVPVTKSSAIGDVGLTALIGGMAKGLGLPMPRPGGHLDEGLLKAILESAARQLKLGAGASIKATGRRSDHPRLVARGRKDSRAADRVLYVGGKATPFRESQRAQAEAWLETEERMKEFAVLGAIVPTQFPLETALDQVLADYWRNDPREREQMNYAILDRQVAALRSFYAGKRLIDVVGSEQAYVAFRGTMPGRDKRPDGGYGGVSRDTASRELEILQRGINGLARFGCTWIPRLIIPKRKKSRATFLYGAEVTRLLLAAHGWTWDDGAGDWMWRQVWDPRGRDLRWDDEAGIVRVVTVNGGAGAMVNRPVIDFEYRRSAVPLKRALLIGVYTGTRHLSVLRLRWTRNGEHGWIDVDTCTLHRADVRKGDTIKKQPPIIMPRALQRLATAWKRLDNSIGPVVHKRDGSGYSTYVSQQFKKLVARAGLSDLKVDDDDRRFVDEDGKRIDVVFHVLRHTCATWLREKGVPLAAAAVYLGMSERTLERTYGHWTREGTRASAAAMNGFCAEVVDEIGWSPLNVPDLPAVIPPFADLPPHLRGFADIIKG